MKKLMYFMTACLLVALMGCGSGRQEAESHFLAGQQHQEAGRLDSALVCYEMAVQADQKLVKAHVALQDLKKKTPGGEDALWDSYEAWAEKSPRDYRAQLLFSRLWPDSDKRMDKAARWAEWKPDEYWVQYFLGEAYEKHNELNYRTEALAAYEKAWELDNSSLALSKKLAQLATWDDLKEKALKYAEHAVTLAPDRIDVLPALWQARLLNAANEDSMKAVLSEQAAAMKADHPDDVMFLKALIPLMYSLDYMQARTMQEEILEKDPDSDMAASFAMRPFFSMSDPENHLDEIKDYLYRYPTHMYAQYAGNIFFKGAEKADAKDEAAWFAMVDELVTEKSATANLYQYALAYLKKAYPEDLARQAALADKWQANAPRKDRGRALTEVADLQLRQQQPDEAIKTLKKADACLMKYAKPQAAVYASMGEAYESLDSTDQALLAYAKSLGMADDDKVSGRFESLYQASHGSQEGMVKFINEQVMALSALKRPYEAPELAFTTLDGETIGPDDLAGKVVMYAIWNPG